jgi:hypothetical protein
MTITGNFADFSWPELLQFLEQGKKTGLLQTEFSIATSEHTTKQTYYIWLHQGRMMAAADRYDQQGLTLMIAQRGWISERVISRVTQISSCFINTPLGLCLKSQGLLQSEQLKLLFNNQILRPVSALFQAQDGVFNFEPTSNLPLGEMTGLSMSATEAILMSLRSLRDWKSLEEKLPDPSSGLSSLIGKQPSIQLNSQEWQVWEFVNGQVSLEKIAYQIGQSVKTIQQIAFRLIVVGLAEEYFMVPNPTMPTTEESIPISASAFVESLPETTRKSPVSQSFLKNLVGFLRTKAA